MVNLLINGGSVAVPRNTTVLQAANSVGIEVPHFCYNHTLLVAGNCRMCLVEITGAPKLVASCARPVAPNMEVWTTSNKVSEARESVMEFRLANHPLDCPICDQGGECDLQDQSMAYGRDLPRFEMAKRGVEDKDCGPLVKTVMTRCIHCTRCIRFASEVAGTGELGTSNRGGDTEVGTYVTITLKSGLSGNLVDLCPVGALTSKPTALSARPWEVVYKEGVDLVEGGAIAYSLIGGRIYRIQPRRQDDLNGEWLGDKGRNYWDGLYSQRVVTPLYRGSPLALGADVTSKAYGLGGGFSTADKGSWSGQESWHDFRLPSGSDRGAFLVESGRLDSDVVLGGGSTQLLSGDWQGTPSPVKESRPKKDLAKTFKAFGYNREELGPSLASGKVDLSAIHPSERLQWTRSRAKGFKGGGSLAPSMLEHVAMDNVMDARHVNLLPLLGTVRGPTAGPEGDLLVLLSTSDSVEDRNALVQLGKSWSGGKVRYEVVGKRQHDYRSAGNLTLAQRVGKAKQVILLGCDLAKESPVLNAKLRERHLLGNVDIYSVGGFGNTFPTFELASSLGDFGALRSSFEDLGEGADLASAVLYGDLDVDVVLGGTVRELATRMLSGEAIVIVGQAARVQSSEAGMAALLDLFRGGSVSLVSEESILDISSAPNEEAFTPLVNTRGFANFQGVLGGTATVVSPTVTPTRLVQEGYRVPSLVKDGEFTLRSFASHGDALVGQATRVLPVAAALETSVTYEGNSLGAPTKVLRGPVAAPSGVHTVQEYVNRLIVNGLVKD